MSYAATAGLIILWSFPGTADSPHTYYLTDVPSFLQLPSSVLYLMSPSYVEQRPGLPGYASCQML
jgi:hypothetical protein